MLAFLAVAAGSVLLGLAGGLLWAWLAPRVVYVAVGHRTAQVASPETSAFIAADGWFCVIAVAGGVVTGLLGYLLAVRRHGALAMAGVLGGGLAAAYAAVWLGQRDGRAHFYALLAAARRGELLRAPLSLGAHEALVFWPLAAGLVAGGLEAVAVLRLRVRTRGAHAAGRPGQVTPAPMPVPRSHAAGAAVAGVPGAGRIAGTRRRVLIRRCAVLAAPGSLPGARHPGPAATWWPWPRRRCRRR